MLQPHNTCSSLQCRMFLLSNMKPNSTDYSTLHPAIMMHLPNNAQCPTQSTPGQDTMLCCLYTLKQRTQGGTGGRKTQALHCQLHRVALKMERRCKDSKLLPDCMMSQPTAVFIVTIVKTPPHTGICLGSYIFFQNTGFLQQSY